jgi:hypothetical protein
LSSTLRLAVTSAGIRSRITSTIRIRETIVTTAVIAIRITAAVVAVAETTGPTIGVITSNGVA